MPVPNSRVCNLASLPKMLQEFSRTGIVREPLFLGAEFGGVRLQPARRGAQGMLHVEHLVIQDEFHGVGGHFGMIQPLFMTI